jgi:hypothetical protein
MLGIGYQGAIATAVFACYDTRDGTAETNVDLYYTYLLALPITESNRGDHRRGIMPDGSVGSQPHGRG